MRNVGGNVGSHGPITKDVAHERYDHALELEHHPKEQECGVDGDKRRKEQSGVGQCGMVGGVYVSAIPHEEHQQDGDGVGSGHHLQ